MPQQPCHFPSRFTPEYLPLPAPWRKAAVDGLAVFHGQKTQKVVKLVDGAAAMGHHKALQFFLSKT